MTNEKFNLTSSCRICLRDEANIPLFEEENEAKNVSSKLVLCVHEKIEDIDGYPRFICKTCNKTLDTLFDFINKYKDSCKILEHRFLSTVKNEMKTVRSNSECNDFSEPEIQLDDVKIEFEHCFDDEVDFVDVNNSKLIVIERPKKARPKRKTVLSKDKDCKTNSIASSILECVYSWTGERWCVSSSLKDHPSPEKVTGRRPKLKLKIKKTKQPRPGKLCDLCGEVFKDADKLRAHKMKSHQPKGKFACPVENCKRICTSNYYLNRHVIRKHSDNKNFVCTECGRTFAFKTEMKYHMRIHNREKYPKKLFTCKYCDKTYKCQKSVDIHERSAHTGLRPAVCSVCSAAFFHEEYLKQHMMLHTGETPFKCPICGRGYAQRGNMKSHMRIHRISELDAATLQKLRPTYLKLLKA